MQTIKRDIYVTKNVLQAPIEVTEGTNSIAIEFDVRDYEIPASAAAVAYSLSTSSMEEPNKALADVSGNKITIIPSEAFFLPGQNVMQIRIIDGNSKLISFNIIVKCTGKMRFGDEKEEQQSTLVEQMLAKLGEYQKKSASPYNFKGSCLSSELPASGNTINDTYYCTDLKYRKTWNGSAWEQSSLNEADYEDELTKTNGEVSSLKEDLVEQIEIKGSDFSLVGGNRDDIPIWNAYYQIETKIAPWIRTPFIRVYPGQIINIKESCHVKYFKDTDYEISGYLTLIPPELPTTVVVPSEVNYMMLFVTTDKDASFNKLIFATMNEPKWSKKNILVETELTDTYSDTVVEKRHTSNGLCAYATDTLIRAAMYPLDGNILYVDSPLNHFYPFAVSSNGNSVIKSMHLSLSIQRGGNKGTISCMWFNTYNNFELTFEKSFESNINGIQILIDNNVLIVNYVYEGELKRNTASVESWIQTLYDNMEHRTGFLTQTGTGDNIAYYGRGFKTYEDYYSFVNEISTSNLSKSNTERIKALEDSGGGTSGTVDFNWSIGMDLPTFGQEYLYALYSKLIGNTPFNVVFAGDSTTAYYAGTNDGLDVLLKNCFEKHGITNGTYINKGVSGINATTWLNTYLSSDIAQNPTLYVIRHGFNNCDGSTEEEMASNFENAMRNALTQIRTSLPISNCSIVLMTPNTSNDDPNNRGESMKKLLEPILRRLAREFGCGFVDTFRTFYDSGAFVSNMYDNPFGDGRHIHPNGYQNRNIISQLFDFVCPECYRIN